MTEKTKKLREFFEKKYPPEKRGRGLFEKMNKFTEVIHAYNAIIDFESDKRFLNIVKDARTGKIYSLNRELKELGVPSGLLLTLEDLK